MSAISRGSRNAFRNPLRTISVTVILGISLGLVLVMLAARSAVDHRIAEVKQSIGNTVAVSPAGARGFLGGGEPLTQSQIEGLKSIPNVTAVDATIDAQLIPNTDTSLQSPTEAGSLGERGGRAFRINGPNSGSAQSNEDVTFTPPILAIGTNNPNRGGELVGNSVSLSSGSVFDALSDENVAVIGQALADKNNLSVGSTFTAYDATITVSGIYDAGNQFANNSVMFPLKTLQRLSGQADEITSATVRVDSVEHLASVTSAVKLSLGDAADVTSSEAEVKNAVSPLASIQNITTTSLVGALIASAVVILLTMVMIVRERRREIAVLKAIGAGEPTIVTQFVTESVVLSLVGSVIGTILGVIFSNPILHALLNSNTGQPGPVSVEGGPGGAGGRVFSVAVGGFRAARSAIQDVQAVIDLQLVLYGLLAAILIAVIGSAFPAWLISKIRPAEVLRNE